MEKKMEKIILIFFVMIIYFSASGKIKNKSKNFLFLLLISVVFFFFLRFISNDLKKINFLIPIIASIICIAIGYLIPMLVRKFISGMEASHPGADGSEEEGDDDYRW